jgi:cell division protein ZapE
MPHRILNVPQHGMIDAYEALLKTRGYQSDPAQRAAAQRLQGLYTELVGFKAARQGSRIKQFLNKPKMPRSVYFWGGVGRGKSFLMDCFYDSVPYRASAGCTSTPSCRRCRTTCASSTTRPIRCRRSPTASPRHTRLLCFDEFHVSDIADAMILGRLLDALFDRGVIFVMTSNYPPDGLYPNGLQRINFLPTIEMIKQRFDVIEVDHGTDYRLRTLEKMELYLVPHDDAAERKMAEDFRRLAGERGPRRQRRDPRAQDRRGAPGARG